MLEKICTKCNKTYPATKDNFYAQKYGKYGLGSTCKPCRKEYDKNPKNKDRANLNSRRYKAKKSSKLIRNIRTNSRRKTDPQLRLAHSIRRDTTSIITRNYINVNGKAVKLLGGTSEFIKTFLETKFYDHPMTGEPMTWRNRGKGSSEWSIDHIQSLSSFDLTEQEQFSIAGHWTNIQPLWNTDHTNKHKSK